MRCRTRSLLVRDAVSTAACLSRAWLATSSYPSTHRACTCCARYVLPRHTRPLGATETNDAQVNAHADLNVSHTIHKLSFGPEFPGEENPLDDFVRTMRKGEPTGTFKVRTRYRCRGALALG